MPRSAPVASRFAPQGMVCAVDHLAAGAGVAMLRAGGSAADAAIAANAVLAVTSQHLCGMGGDLFALVHDARGEPLALDASGRAGSGADPGRLRAEGHDSMPPARDIRSVTVPGCVDGWLVLHARFGRLPLDEVLAPAMRYASEGFPASPTLAASAPRVVGLPGGDDFRAATHPGAPVRRLGAARTLAAIAREGRDGFYGGEFGSGLLALGNGEYVEDDLARPGAGWVSPISAEAWGQRIWTVPPASQGYLVPSAAFIAGRLPLPEDAEDPLWAHLTVEAARLAGHDRLAVLHEHADGVALLDPDRLLRRAGAISPTARARLGDGAAYRRGGTTYLCAVDSARLGVSLIQSNAQGFGAGIAEPSTGIFLQNRGIGFSLEPGHPAEYGPGRRPPHTLSPALVTSGAGDLSAVLGTMGGDAQPQVLLQLLARLLHGSEGAGDALAAGRWSLAARDDRSGFGTWSDAGEVVVELESATPAGWPAALRALGHDVVRHEEPGRTFGHAQVILCRGDVLEGAADPRSLGGAAAGY